MKVGLIGPRYSGKTAIFNVLTTGYNVSSTHGANLGIIKVPDKNIDGLAKIWSPKKITYSEIQFVDFDRNVDPGDSILGSPKLISEYRTTDALVIIIDTYSGGPEKALKDAGNCISELVLNDLVLVENRIERIKKTSPEPGEKELLEKLTALFEKEDLLNGHDWTEAEMRLMSQYGFLTLKPVMILWNVEEARHDPALEKYSIPNMQIAGQIEQEIAEMEEEDRQEFIKDLGFEEPARDRFIKEIYRLMNYISFYTMGPDEVRAWTIVKGTSAQKAAGKIHSDIERGFIRAEVIPVEVFLEYKDESKVKAAGRMRVEGKEYIINDTEIVHYRFNV